MQQMAQNYIILEISW